MEFKIFKAGTFTEADINAFLSENIILKDKYLENGDIYVFFKNKAKIGTDLMSEIEQIDRLVTKAQQEILIARFDIVDIDTQIADVAEKIKDVKPNQKGWDELQNSRKQLENQKRLSERTISERETTIVNLRAAHQELLNSERAEINTKR